MQPRGERAARPVGRRPGSIPLIMNFTSPPPDSSVAACIGVQPLIPRKMPAAHPAWRTDCHVLPDDVQAEAANIIQGRASVGERPPNAFRRDL